MSRKVSLWVVLLLVVVVVAVLAMSFIAYLLRESVPPPSLAVFVDDEVVIVWLEGWYPNSTMLISLENGEILKPISWSLILDGEAEFYRFPEKLDPGWYQYGGIFSKGTEERVCFVTRFAVTVK